MNTIKALAVCGIISLAWPATAAPLQLHSQIDSTLTPSASAGGDSVLPVLSADGRFVLFASTANNLALATTNVPYPAPLYTCHNVYLRDRASNTTVLVSVSLDGRSGANQDAMPGTISADGRFALFESAADNLAVRNLKLATGPTNIFAQVFVRDLLNGTNFLVSVNTNGTSANGDSFSAVMTPDGRYVAFASAAPDLVTNDTNGIVDVFVRDLQNATTVCASQGARTTNSTLLSRSDAPVITPDGRYVAFYSSATNLVPGQKVFGEVYVRDLVAGATTWVSAQARSQYKDQTGFTNVVSCAPSISDDGNYIAFETCTNAPSATSARGIILRYNRGTGETVLVNTNAYVPLVSFENTPPITMTPDGRFIAFTANIQNAAGTNTAIYLWDAQTTTSTLISADTNGALPDAAFCGSPCVSADGLYVAFVSTSPALNTNAVGNVSHLYLRDVAGNSTSVLDADTNGVSAADNSVAAVCLTPDGRFAAFDTLAPGLVANDNNRASDVFLRDTSTGAVELISVRQPLLPSVTGGGYTSSSSEPLSRDGHFLVFASEADNLAPGATNHFANCFVRDVYAGTNRLVSADVNGTASTGISFEPAISGNGRYVTFTSAATNLIPGDTNNALDVFARDLQTDTTWLVSANAAGTGEGNGDSYSPLINADRRFILFLSKAGNLAAGSFGGKENLFLRDQQAATNCALTTGGQAAYAMTPDGHYIVFTDTAGAGSGTLYIWDTQMGQRTMINSGILGIKALGISPDGRRVACFASGASSSSLAIIDRVSNVTWQASATAPGTRSGLRFSADGNFLTYAGAPVALGTSQVYLCDISRQTNILVSQNATGVLGNGSSDSPDISADGQFVVYRSAADNLMAGTTNSVPGIYLFDAQTGTNVLLSADRYNGGSGNNRSLRPIFSGDGHTLVFRTWANDLVAGDFNQTADLVAYAFLYANINNDSAGGLTIDWPTAPGQNFVIQYKDDLAGTAWHAFAGTIHTNGNRASLTDPYPTSNHRFYRVVSDQ